MGASFLDRLSPDLQRQIESMQVVAARPDAVIVVKLVGGRSVLRVADNAVSDEEIEGFRQILQEITPDDPRTIQLLDDLESEVVSLTERPVDQRQPDHAASTAAVVKQAFPGRQVLVLGPELDQLLLVEDESVAMALDHIEEIGCDPQHLTAIRSALEGRRRMRAADRAALDLLVQKVGKHLQSTFERCGVESGLLDLQSELQAARVGYLSDRKENLDLGVLPGKEVRFLLVLIHRCLSLRDDDRTPTLLEAHEAARRLCALAGVPDVD